MVRVAIRVRHDDERLGPYSPGYAVIMRCAGELASIAWLGVAVISSAALYSAENGINPNIHSPMDAPWWGVVMLTTVGYGDVSPVTPEGRLAGAALMILGITLFAAITGTITSFLIASQSDAPSPGIPEQIRQLAISLPMASSVRRNSRLRRLSSSLECDP